ncbi:MAG: phosphoenolpyruvate hydrolase family protein [Oscillospiraceae bacterium]
MKREEILRRIGAQISVTGHVIGTVAGSGMTARYTAMGGADLILALSAGKFRIMGRSSFTSFFCFGNSNDIVLELGTKELLPLLADVPVLFGLNACDPLINLYDYINNIKLNGFSGIVNFPTVCLIDGQFREALEEDGNTYEKEIEAISLARYLDLFTLAFVRDEEQARRMAQAGADVVCAHLGFTKGGYVGAKQYLPIERARLLAESVFRACDEVRTDVIKMVYGGPANTPQDVRYLYDNTCCNGYIGGSTFDRIPTEQAILETTRAFKQTTDFATTLPGSRGAPHEVGYAEFVRRYVDDNYMKEIRLYDLALVAHVSAPYLSGRFKEAVGCSFTEYLVRCRMNKAESLIVHDDTSLSRIAELVGYSDYAQFSKMFKKHKGVSPSELRKKAAQTKSM